MYLSLLLLGIALMFVGSVGIVIQAFRDHLGWGVACLLFSPAQWAFVPMHWSKTYHVFTCQILGLVLMITCGPMYEQEREDSLAGESFTSISRYMAPGDETGLLVSQDELLGTWKVLFVHDKEPMDHLLEYTFHSDGVVTFCTQYEQDESSFDTFDLPYSYDGVRLEVQTEDGRVHSSFRVARVDDFIVLFPPVKERSIYHFKQYLAPTTARQ